MDVFVYLDKEKTIDTADIVQLCGLWSSPVSQSDQIWHLLSNFWFKY